MHIAVFDYFITPNSPSGNCLLQMISGLHKEHDFTVFAREFINPCPERIRWIRVPVVRRPLFLLFVIYHICAPLAYLAHRIRYGTYFDLILGVESNLIFPHVSYVHFCHRAFISKYYARLQVRGIRKWAGYLTYRLHALLEPWVFRRSRSIIVPSQGLARELVQTYPGIKYKITVIPNPVDVDRMSNVNEFDRNRFRKDMGMSPEDLVVVFVALGDFERKGLPILLPALQKANDSKLKLLVVGGTTAILTEYRRSTQKWQLDSRVIFAGMQKDVRPYLWMADVFALPSCYEVFPLVTLEAAGAGLPLVVTHLYGVEEFIHDGENGWIVHRDVDSLYKIFTKICEMDKPALEKMGKCAQNSVQIYKTDNFIDHWRQFLTRAEIS